MKPKRLIPLVICGPLIAPAGVVSAQWNGENPSPRRADRDEAVFVWVETEQQNIAEYEAAAAAYEEAVAANARAEAERVNNQQQLTAPPSDPSRPPHYDSWIRIAQCESGGNWSINTGNGFYGGLQFTLQSWRGVGMGGYPHQHSMIDQMWGAERLLDMQGWGAWPVCSSRR